MVKDEKTLELLYELLTLYFEFSPESEIGNTFEPIRKVEPALDRVIFKERLFAIIADTIMELMAS